jgi:CRP-like cAMP-binding protein
MCRYEAYESGQILFGEDSDAVKLFLVLSGFAQVVAKPELTASLRGVPSELSQAVTEQAVELTRSLKCSWTGIRWRAEMHHLSPIVEQKSGDYFGETALAVHGSVMVDTKATADVANNDIEDSRCANDGEGDRSSNHAATEQPVSGHIFGAVFLRNVPR